MNLLRSLIAGIALAVLTSGAAFGQCGTTAPANKFCGNDTGSSALATWKTIPASALTPIAGGTVLGNRTGATAVPTAVTNPVLGIPGTSTGEVGLAGATSGTAILRAQAAAGSAVSLLPTSPGTLVSTAVAPLVIDATTGQITVTQSALTKVDDTNVTLTLGGSPSTALLAAASITAGWSGQLSAARGGTGQGSYTLGDTLYASGTSALSKLAGNITTAKQYLSQTGNGSVSAAPAWATIAGVDITGAALTSSNDTNVTLTLGGTPATSLLRAASLTMGWTGTLAVARGGTGGGSASGTLLDNITGFASTGFIQRTGAGTYSFTASTALPLTVGTSPVNSGTTTRVLFDNAGVLGEYTISGSGSVAMTTSPSFTTPSLGVATGTSLALGGAAIGSNALAATGTSALAGAVTVTSTSANALAVGANGTTNPGLQVDNSIASAATGIRIFPQAAGASISIRAISSGTNEALGIDAKGSGQIALGTLSTGGVRMDGPLAFNTGPFSGSAFGTNVATGLGTATGSPNGFPRILASGTIALGTSAISAGTCGSAATAAATNTATTDVIDVGFNSDPTGVTGYTPSAMLTIVVYPTANTVNVKQCNLTAASITPSALTLNWWVRR